DRQRQVRRQALEGADAASAGDLARSAQLLRSASLAAEGSESRSIKRRIDVRDVAEVIARFRAAGEIEFLVKSLIPAETHVVLGDEDKSGKSLTMDDLAVSVVTGTPWLGHFPVDAPGPVTLFYGEGGDRNLLRRLDAIVRDRGGSLADLGDLRL